jgi:hypothetical protein
MSAWRVRVWARAARGADVDQEAVYRHDYADDAVAAAVAAALERLWPDPPVEIQVRVLDAVARRFLTSASASASLDAVTDSKPKEAT